MKQDNQEQIQQINGLQSTSQVAVVRPLGHAASIWGEPKAKFKFLRHDCMPASPSFFALLQERPGEFAHRLVSPKSDCSFNKYP